MTDGWHPAAEGGPEPPPAEPLAHESAPPPSPSEQQAYEPRYAPPPSQPAPAPPPSQPASAPAPKRSTGVIVLIVVGVVLGLLACCGAVAAAILIFGSSGGAEPWKLSADQTRIVQEFGPPQTFSIVCGADPKNDDPDGNEFPIHRIETWSYHDLGAQFYFRDGVALGTTSTPVVPAGTEYPKLRPEEFYRGMSVKDVIEVVGANPTKAADIAPDLLTGVEAYIFRDVVVAVFDEDGLVTVQTIPWVPEGGTP